MTAATDTAQQQSTTPVGNATALVAATVFSPRPVELAAFYGMLLGLRFERRQHDDARDHRVARIGNLRVTICDTTTDSGDPTPDWGSAEPPTGPSAVELRFEVPDVAASCEYAQRLGAAVLRRAAPLDGGVTAVVLDPDGNRLCLWSRDADTHDNDDNGEDA